MMGTANEFNVLRYNHIALQHKITKGDVVLFALAEPERQWHIIDIPWLGTLRNLYAKPYEESLVNSAPDPGLRKYQIDLLKAYQECLIEPYVEKEGVKPVDRAFINYFSHIEMIHYVDDTRVNINFESH